MAEGIGFTNELFSVLRPDTLGTLRVDYDLDKETFADGDLLSAIQDQSGNGLHLAQATSGNQPTGKVNAASGHRAALFTANDFMTATLGTLNSPITVFVVCKFANLNQGSSPDSGDEYVLNIGDGSSTTNVGLVRAGSGRTVPDGFTIDQGGAYKQGLPITGQQWQVLCFTLKTSATRLHTFQNDLADITQTDVTGTINTNGDLTVGRYGPSAYGYFNGYVARILIFENELAYFERNTIQRYLQAKYKIDYFDPASISGLVSKFLGDGLRLRDSEAISEWEDPISGYNLLQATGANQPLCIKNQFDSKRSVARFDGSNDFLRSASFTAMSQPRTIIAVAKNTSNAAIRTLLDGIASGNRHTINYQTSGNLLIYAGTGLNSGVNAGLGWNIISTQFNGGSSLIRRNGAQENSGAGGSNTLTGYTVGALYDDSLPFIGDVYALLFFDGALSTLNMQRLESWLKGLTAL